MLRVRGLAIKPQGAIRSQAEAAAMTSEPPPSPDVYEPRREGYSGKRQIERATAVTGENRRDRILRRASTVAVKTAPIDTDAACLDRRSLVDGLALRDHRKQSETVLLSVSHTAGVFVASMVA